LILRDYQSVNGTDLEPRIYLDLAEERHGDIKIEFKKGSFVISLGSESLPNRPDVETILRSSLGFVGDEDRVSSSVSPAAIESTVLALAKAFAT
jgi:hypothetical protein